MENLTIKITQHMPITYEIETDYLYNKGIEKKIDVICKARLNGSTIEFIAKIVSLPAEKVREILDTMKIE